MNELNYFPFYYELLNPYPANDVNENKDDKIISDVLVSEWQQEYELINLSHQLEYGW